VDLEFVRRTQAFWDWFSVNEEKLSELVQHGEAFEESIPFISSGVELLGEGVNFNIGGDFEFTFAVAGNEVLFFLLPYVTANLPEKYQDKWTFFPCIQGVGDAYHNFRIQGTCVDINGVMVFAGVNKEEGSANLSFYVNGWETLEEQECYNAFYTLMELVIGEALTHGYVHNVEKVDAYKEDMFPLTELKQWMITHFCEDGEIPHPVQRYSGYEKEPKKRDMEDYRPRDDVVVGVANCFPLVSFYEKGDNGLYQGFAKFGAKPLFLYYYYDQEHSKRSLDERNDLMDKLEDHVLGKRGSGREIGLMLGGAMGERCAYIDILLYDYGAFMERVREVLVEFPHMIFGKEFYRGGQEFLLTDYTVPGFVERLNRLHEMGSHDVDAHKEILEILEAIPNEKMDFVLIGMYARALINTDQKEKAIETLELVRHEGEIDALWNWRMGYVLYRSKRILESVPYLQRAVDLGDKAEDTTNLLKQALAYQRKHSKEERKAAKIEEKSKKVR